MLGSQCIKWRSTFSISGEPGGCESDTEGLTNTGPPAPGVMAGHRPRTRHFLQLGMVTVSPVGPAIGPVLGPDIVYSIVSRYGHCIIGPVGPDIVYSSSI